jgi:hypothetical protein
MLHNIEDRVVLLGRTLHGVRRQRILESSQFSCAASTRVTENTLEARPIAAQAPWQDSLSVVSSRPSTVNVEIIRLLCINPISRPQTSSLLDCQPPDLEYF